ncbi:hypothetical protein [Sporolactobacillus laevolacticus]|uniref:Uncharacterized protein n=1 Tax=Sporolactobacillus laevolacticus DSM 442 TaxID=1395513 RepID=V6JA22_9BACL|nr:hypothetical protein [Sporolactobacillus laevolacticus]EST13629.1 hypothetical protein P343_02515 [Sporolactobacillus laevolacticus DSM 442]
MVYLLSVLSLTLNPFVWKKHYRKSKFLWIQALRLAAGLLIIFFVSYIGLVDHTWQAFLSYGTLFWGIFLFLDIIYLKERFVAVEMLCGVCLLLFFSYLHFIYPLTVTKAKYDFAAAKTTVVSREKHSMDEQHIPVVPEKYARYKSEKILGELAHVSYYELGHTSLQKIDGQLYWVTPIEYSGFFKWMKSHQVPGYIRMSAEDENANATLVKRAMKYVPSAYFSENLQRHVRSHYKSPILFRPSFEPDETGKPYYVVAYGYYQKLRQIPDIEGVFVVDPKTGTIRNYRMNRLPAFIDQAIPSNVAEQWNDWYGENVHGFWNKLFAQEDIKRPTAWSHSDEVNGVFDHKLNLNWFTDFTRPKSGSGAMVGYSMLNTRTGRITYYSGANGLLNGKSAMNVAEKTFKQNKYEAGIPNLYTIYGQETWVVPLMDSNDVLRELMLIHAKNENVYSAETDKRTLFDNYKYAVATKLGSDSSVPTNQALLKKLVGTVTKVYKYQDSDTRQTVTQFMIQGSEKIFTVTSGQNPYSVFLKTGDKVSIQYIDTKETVSAVKDFTLQSKQ